MSSWSEGRRPLTLAILALGGEGGGVLSDWIVAAAEGAGYTAQNTSVAGVAQRTGATVYYAEMFPPDDRAAADDRGAADDRAAPDDRAAADDRGAADAPRAEPVMSLFPTPGEVDVVIASELMECGRAIQRGFSTPDRTTLITSTNRVYSIDEKMALGDGRVDDGALLAAARAASRRLVASDFAALAASADSVISASLLGALAGSGALPFTREQFEAPVRAFGRAVESSLAAFAAGFDAARAAGAAHDGTGHDGTAHDGTAHDGTGHDGTAHDGTAHDGTGHDGTAHDGAAQSGAGDATAASDARASLPLTTWAGSSRTIEAGKESEERRRVTLASEDPAALVGPALAELARETLALPRSARSMILHGLVRTAVYQDLDYARRYLRRVARFAEVEPDRDGEARLTLEAARHIALWMCYQDTIHVALQKTRQARMERVREEAKVRPGQLLHVHEFLHPRVEEITDTLPRPLGAALRRSRTFARVVGPVVDKGMILDTTSLVGSTLLTTMARARPLRPRSLRFAREQRAIELWIDRALRAAAADPELGREVLECQRVLKGYGATWARGSDSFDKLMVAADHLISGSGFRPGHGSGSGDDARAGSGAAAELAALRDAALADEDGAALEARLSAPVRL